MPFDFSAFSTLHLPLLNAFPTSMPSTSQHPRLLRRLYFAIPILRHTLDLPTCATSQHVRLLGIYDFSLTSILRPLDFLTCSTSHTFSHRMLSQAFGLHRGWCGPGHRRKTAHVRNWGDARVKLDLTKRRLPLWIGRIRSRGCRTRL